MKRIALLALVSVIALALAAAGAVHAQSGGAFELTWFTLDGGGEMDLSGGTFALGSTAGQPDAAGATGGTFALQGGFWNPSSTAPLAVTLASFAARADGDHILVTWETVSELDNAGFNLYRGPTDAAPDTLLAFVPSQAPGSSQGYSYSFTDSDVEPGQTVWYWLEDLSLTGIATLHGPVSATLLPPTAVTVSGLQAGGSADPALPLWLLAAVGLFVSALLARRRRSRSAV